MCFFKLCIPCGAKKVRIKLLLNCRQHNEIFKHITINTHTVKKMKIQVFRGIWNFCIKRTWDTKFEVKIPVISIFDGGSLIPPTTVQSPLSVRNLVSSFVSVPSKISRTQLATSRRRTWTTTWTTTLAETCTMNLDLCPANSGIHIHAQNLRGVQGPVLSHSKVFRRGPFTFAFYQCRNKTRFISEFPLIQIWVFIQHCFWNHATKFAKNSQISRHSTFGRK